MKILLLGEFSGFHGNLAIGLRSHGIEVEVASLGDGFKDILRDIDIPKTRVKRFFFYKKLLKKLKQYDLIQIMGDAALYSNPIFAAWFIRAMSKQVPVYMIAAGCDYNFWSLGRRKLDIPFFNEVKKYKERCPDRFVDFLRNYFILRYITGIIGFNEYFEAYKDHPKCLQPVPLPFVTEKIDVSPLDCYSEPLIVLHGLQSLRKGFKGSYVIEEAFKQLNKKYPQELKCICIGDLPYNEYKALMRRAHILVDQTNFISYGINALLGMAMGKVVCCGSQGKAYYDLWLPLSGIEEYPPIVPLKLDANFIVEQIEKLLKNREQLNEISKKSIVFVEKYHNATKVASMFIQRWQLAVNDKENR